MKQQSLKNKLTLLSWHKQQIICLFRFMNKNKYQVSKYAINLLIKLYQNNLPNNRVTINLKRLQLQQAQPYNIRQLINSHIESNHFQSYSQIYNHSINQIFTSRIKMNSPKKVTQISILNKSKITTQQSSEEQSFLLRYFHSKQFIFPIIDQQLVNSKIQSLQNFCKNYQTQGKDFKSWVLNKYPLNSYFKNIIMQNVNNCQVLTNNKINRQKSKNNKKNKNKESQDKFVNFFIGETQGEQKHGYGLEIKVYKKSIQEDENISRSSSQQSSQEEQIVEFIAYEGFYQNNLKHGKGKLFTFISNSKSPNFYQGKFINNQTHDSNTCLMVWKNNDFYIGKVKPNFSKQGHGILFISNKLKINKSTLVNINNDQNSMHINLINDPKLYQKVIISQWLEDSPKPQNLQISSSCTLHSLLSQTKIITHNEFYFGQAYVYYSMRFSTHVTVKQGQGQLKLINNDHYMGSFESDLIHGYGKYTWSNSNFYIGELYKGLKHGTGFFKQHTTGDQYEGQYQHNKRHGQGQYRWSNGNLYHGQFVNQLRQGQGKMIWNTGQVYQGGWKDGLQNGMGKLYMKEGNAIKFIRQSQFVNGIEMQTAQDVSQLPSVLSKKSNLSQTNNQTLRTSNFSSSRLRSLPNEAQFKNFRNTSQLPKINERTITRFKAQSQPKHKSKTQNLQPILEKMKRKIPKITSQNSYKSTQMQRQRSLDSKMTQKLPYHRPLHSQSSSDKKQITRTASFFQSSKKKKTYYVDLQDIRETQKNVKNNFSDKETQNEQEMIDFFSDTLMTPIKWGNIKTKSHKFIFQRKQRKPTPPDLTIGRK